MMVIIVFVIACAIVSCSWYLWATHALFIFQFFSQAKSNDVSYPNSGTWGDTFGSLNALFAGLGLVGIVTTISLQIISNKNQKKDNHKQIFEDSIFKLIDLIKEARERVTFYDSVDKKRYSDRVAFRKLSLYFGSEILEFRKTTGEKFLPEEKLISLYNTKFHIKNEANVSSYFRLINYTLNKIKNDRILTEDEKIEYGNLIRGQFDWFEVSIIAINGLTKYSGNMKHLVENFRMLRYIKKGTYLEGNLKKFYSKEAFSQRGDRKRRFFYFWYK
ncbi:putative phage abortive infection protein [Novacetimonas hansenii]|uniref:putative phage abortive infection protein n=1 Tax=Novacetimonas hansenii TaxID=436 RepID=UPI0009D74713|nr:putative phage abortive infection protein [Novacetimonas hansenii]